MMLSSPCPPNARRWLQAVVLWAAGRHRVGGAGGRGGGRSEGWKAPAALAHPLADPPTRPPPQNAFLQPWMPAGWQAAGSGDGTRAEHCIRLAALAHMPMAAFYVWLPSLGLF